MLGEALIIIGFFFLLLIIIIMLGEERMRWELRNKVGKLFLLTKDVSREKFTYDQLKGLPQPVQKYFKHVLRKGQLYVNYARLKYSGKFRLGSKRGWMDIKGEEYFTTGKVGLVWLGRTRIFSALDSYIDGVGQLRSKLLSVVKVADKRGEKIDRAEILRWLAEAPWCPVALLPSDKLKWEAIDKNSAKVILFEKGWKVEGVYYFNNKGEITEFRAERYKEDSPEEWIGRYKNYKKVKTMKIPFDVEVAWEFDAGKFTYARFCLLEIRYNSPELFG